MLTEPPESAPNYTLHALMQLRLTMNIQTWADTIEVEHRLKNKNIADIYFTWGGDQWIVEVKSEYKMSLIENAIGKYWSQCDYLLFAAPLTKIRESAVKQMVTWDNESLGKVGILGIGPTEIELLRAPQRLRRKTGSRR